MHRGGKGEPIGQAIGVTPGVVGIEVEILRLPIDMIVVVRVRIVVVALRPLDAGIYAASAAGLGQVFLGLCVRLVDRISSGVGGIGPIHPVAVRIVGRVIDVG